MNIQFAIQHGKLYVLEVNPRASRTVPFVSKAIGVPMARAAALLAAGRSLESLGLPPEREPVDFFIKAPVFPFRKFPGEDVLLGPEMKSTGEVMGISPRFGDAFAKACEAVGTRLPLSGAAFLTVNPYDKAAVIPIGRELVDLGFALCATEGTREALREAGRRRRTGLQGQRREPQRGGPDGSGGDPARDQHAARKGSPASTRRPSARPRCGSRSRA